MTLAIELLEAANARLGEDDRALVARALRFAAECHVEQRRDDGSPYLAHPIRTALIVASELALYNPAALCAALLHDTLEDRRSLSRDDLRPFGDAVANIVEAVTKPPAAGRSHREVNAIYFPRLLAASELARTAKLADRLDNIRDLPTSPNPGKRRRMVDETRSFYVPLVGTLSSAEHRPRLERTFAEALAIVERLTDG